MFLRLYINGHFIYFKNNQIINLMLQCDKPVISVIHNACIGGGVDLISAADMRYCTEDAWFQIKETEIGL